MTQNYKLISGIEIEAEYNRELMGYIERDNYHGRRSRHYDDNKNFSCENDGSVSTSKYDNGDTVEIISRVFELKKASKFLKIFQDETFKRIARHNNITIQEAKKHELHEIFNFNNSTGTHVHYSALKISNTPKTYRVYNRSMASKFEHATPLNFKAIASASFYTQLNDKVLRAVKEKLPSVSREFARGFYRDYAKRINEDDTINNIRHDRVMSHNLRLQGFEHVEFRSFNLRSVKTWDDLFKMFEILANVFYEHFNENISNKFKTQYQEILYRHTENDNAEIDEIESNNTAESETFLIQINDGVTINDLTFSPVVTWRDDNNESESDDNDESDETGDN